VLEHCAPPPTPKHRPGTPPYGRAKLHLIHRVLALRARDPALFADGDYRPLAVDGPLADHVCAFARTHPRPARGRALVVIVPRLLARVALDADPAAEPAAVRDDLFATAHWTQTRVSVPAGAWRERLGGARLDATRRGEQQFLRVADVLRRFPVGLLTPAGDEPEPGPGDAPTPDG
jgi:Maltooligosyl trehalose synthase